MKVKKFACIALDITYPTGFGLGVEIDGNETEKNCVPSELLSTKQKYCSKKRIITVSWLV